MQRAANSVEWVTRTLVRAWVWWRRSRRVKTASAVRGVEVAGGLIGEQDFGVGDEGAGERDALLLAAGELTGAVLGALGKADFSQPGLGSGEGLFAGDAGGEQRHGDVLKRGELWHEVVELPDVADLRVAETGGGFGGEVRDFCPVDDDGAAGRGVKRGEEVEEGGFAGAGLAYDGKHLPWRDGEVEVGEEVERRLAGIFSRVGFGEVLGLDHGVGG